MKPLFFHLRLSNAKRWLAPFVFLALGACGVKSRPVPPTNPYDIGHGQPTLYKKKKPALVNSTQLVKDQKWKNENLEDVNEDSSDKDKNTDEE